MRYLSERHAHVAAQKRRILKANFELPLAAEAGNHDAFAFYSKELIEASGAIRDVSAVSNAHTCLDCGEKEDPQEGHLIAHIDGMTAHGKDGAMTHLSVSLHVYLCPGCKNKLLSYVATR